MSASPTQPLSPSRPSPQAGTFDRFGRPQFYVVALLIIGTAALDWGCIWIVYKHALTNEAYGLMMGVLGIWHTAFATAYGYVIGTSSGSKDKDETISNLTK